MRLHLDHALAHDTSIGAPTRTVFATTIVGYAHDLTLLARRARDVAAHGRAVDPDRVAELVVEAARTVLELRAAVQHSVLELIRARAAAAIPDADSPRARLDVDDATRRRWSAARRELEALAGDPARIATGPIGARLGAHPEQLDEPAVEDKPTFADMIELD